MIAIIAILNIEGGSALTLSISNQPSSFKKENTGALIVQTFTSKRAFPVSQAEVVISQNTPDGEKVIYKGQTDISGKLFTIPLPCINTADTLNPKIGFQDNVKNYSYKITVTHPDFLTMIFYNIPVFEGTISIQSVDLVPKSLSTDPDKPIEIHHKQSRI